MATANLAFGAVGGASVGGRPQILHIRTSETHTNLASSNQSAAADPIDPREGYEAVQVTTDTALWVVVNEDPTASASADDRVLVLANQTRDFFVPKGHKMAIIEATL